MAFPLFAAIAAASALPAVLRKKKKIQEPDFFVKNPQEMEALIRQKTQAQYGGMDSAIRESLSNAGVLSPSSLSDTLTRSTIGEGQDIASQILGLYSGEFARSRDFQTNKYFQEKGLEQQRNTDMLSYLASLGGAVGEYYGGKTGKIGKKKKTLEDLLAPTEPVDFNPAPDYGVFG